MNIRLVRFVGLVALTVSIAACQGGSTSELTGKVTFKGAPLTTGEVIVKSDSGLEVSGGISADGSYSIKNAPRGMLKVKIVCMDEKASTEYFLAVAGRGKGEPRGPDGKVRPKGSPILEMSAFSKIPAKYAEYETSGQTIEVKDAKVQKDIPLD